MHPTTFDGRRVRPLDETPVGRDRVAVHVFGEHPTREFSGLLSDFAAAVGIRKEDSGCGVTRYNPLSEMQR